jgi:hypothetical protein
MKHQVVVARHGENLDWLECRPDGVGVVVYNKRRLPNQGYWHEGTRVVELLNLGRESQTYLHHIVQNYDRLADVTLFTQGDPYAHVPRSFNVFDLLTAGPGISGHRLCTGLKEWDAEGRLVHWGKWLDQYRSGAMGKAKLSMVDWFKGNVGVDPEALGSLAYFPGAVFAATRDAVRSWPRSVYLGLLQSVSHHQNPEEAYYVERAWVYLLGRDGVNYATTTGNGGGLCPLSRRDG